MIKSIYKNPTTNILLKDEKLNGFPIRLVIQKEYSFSPCLFSVVLELLAIAIRQKLKQMKKEGRKEGWKERREERRKERESIQIGKKIKLSLFANNMIAYIENLKGSTKKHKELISEVNKLMGCRILTLKNQFLYINNE